MSQPHHALRAAWGDYLTQYQWDYFVTLSTGLPSTRNAIERHFQDRFIRRLARSAQQHIAWFYVGETGARGREHAHALLWTGGEIAARLIEGAWRIGKVTVAPFQPELGGSHYLAKTIGEAGAQYDVSRRLPPPAVAMIH